MVGEPDSPMSYALCKAYFRARVAELPTGTFGKEWTDTFNIENIPANVIDKAWHLSSPDATSNQRNQVDLVQRQPIRFQALFKGLREVEGGFEKAEAAAKLLIQKVVDPTIATIQGNELKNVEFRTKSISPQSGTNDNLVLLTLDFDVLLVFNT